MGTFISDIFNKLLSPEKLSSSLNEFILIMCLFLGFYIIQVVLGWIQGYILIRLSQKIGFDIRFDLFNKLQRLSISYLDTQSTGGLMSCFTNDVDVVVSTFSQTINQLVNAVFVLIGSTIMLFLINPILAAISIGLALVLFVFVGFFIKKAQPYFLRQQQILAEITADVEEYNFAHKMTTIYGYQRKIIDAFEKKTKDLRSTSTHAQIISGLIFPYNNFINNIIITIITSVIVVLMCFRPDLLELGAFGFNGVAVASLYLMLLRQTTSQISTIFSQFNLFQLAFAALARIKNVLVVPNEVTKHRTKSIEINKGRIEFKNVSFGYYPNKRVLNNINFVAEPGTMNAIVGPTGSGKTTIISLLAAYYDIDEGEIAVDGQDISKYTKHSIRESIALVLQDSFLFSGTIMDNIRYGRLSATDEEVFKAAKVSSANKFIEKLPDGYKTLVANDSELLSEGEKQLISIARAFLSNAKIIVLDEATSYVDTKTEKDIQAGMRKLMKAKTSIVIAHRLSTIKDADNIVVIKDGIQVESGNHETLMDNKSFYYKLNTAMDQDFDDPKEV